MRFGIKAAATLIVFISMAFSACNLPGAGSDSDPQDQQQDVPTDYFTDQGFGNPLGYIQQPCAEYYKGVTYVAFQGSHEDAYVCSYNHDKQQWTGPIRAGVSMMGKTPDPVDNDQVDNHGRPALVVDNEGYIHLCFGGHGGYEWLGENQFGRPGKGKQTHVVSKRPEDISEWKELEDVSPFGTYNQFIKMDNGDIYLFYRHGSHKSDWVYQKSTDNGRTFEKEVPVLKSKLLADTVTLLKPQGVICYSTCSIAKEENSEQVKGFLRNNPGFELESEELTSITGAWILSQASFEGPFLVVSAISSNGALLPSRDWVIETVLSHALTSEGLAPESRAS